MTEELIKLIDDVEEADAAAQAAFSVQVATQSALRQLGVAIHALAFYIVAHRAQITETPQIVSAQDMPDVAAKRFAVERARENGTSINYVVRFFDDGDDAALFAMSQTWMPGLYYRIWDFEADCCVWDGRKLQREGWGPK